MKLASHYRDRHIADPDFAAIPVAALLSDETADRLAGLIDMQRALDIRAVPPGSETVCLCAVDRGRLAVSFINSVYSSFGSGIVLPKAGFALQNRGCGFVTEPGHPNCIGPGKRPLHTIIPALVQKKVLIETGVAESIRRGLAHRGHDLAISPKPLGGAQAIVIDRARGVLCGGSDPRKDGLALGF